MVFQARLPFPFVQNFVIFERIMIPDYPHKLFADKRSHYSLLMVTLAMDSAAL
jgi:hypothetical protein